MSSPYWQQGLTAAQLAVSSIRSVGDQRHVLAGRPAGNSIGEIDRPTHSVVRQVKLGRSPHGVWTIDHPRSL